MHEDAEIMVPQPGSKQLRMKQTMCIGDFKTKSLLPLHIKMSSESLMGPFPMYTSDELLSALNTREQKTEKMKIKNGNEDGKENELKEESIVNWVKQCSGMVASKALLLQWLAHSSLEEDSYQISL